MTDLHPGMIVVAQRPDRPGIEMVKRIAAVPGQMVTTLDGARYRLEPDQFFLVGDNPAASTDSRHFGPVPRGLIRAVARWRYWPLPPRRL